MAFKTLHEIIAVKMYAFCLEELKITILFCVLNIQCFL